jgi:DNA mismatch repair protein MutS
MAKMTPMMQRYCEVKQENPGSILLFRMGDFYELFHEDAQAGAKILGLTLTARDKTSDNPVPMAGFPHHQLENYLQKLIKAGFRAAICDQVEDPKTAKGMVRREVTRVVTPGTLTDEQLLDPRESNFLACVFPGKKAIGLSWLELSTGRFLCSELEPSQLADELARIHPAEVLTPEVDSPSSPVASLRSDGGMVITERPTWSFSNDQTRTCLLDHFGTRTLEGFDLNDDSVAVTAAGALLEYVFETQKSAVGHITRLEPYTRGGSLQIDQATRRSLELTQTIREGSRDGSLLAIMDETVTSMGARLLADWLSNPLTDIKAINGRLDAVEEFMGNATLLRDVRELLDQSYDMQRLISRVATGRTSPRDIGCLGSTLALLPKLKAKLAERESGLLCELEQRLNLFPDLRAEIEGSLVDEPPLNTVKGGVIRGGVNKKLDGLRELTRGGKEWIAAYVAEEAERTGIPNLKTGFNKVFGYYLEVTAAHKDKVPDDYIRKQTLKNQERYITPALKEHEEKVLRSEEEAFALENELFEAIKAKVAAEVPGLQAAAEIMATIDCLGGLATLASSAGYCRPELTEEPVLDVREGRHPVLDRLQPTGQFVPNDVRLGIEETTASGGDDTASEGTPPSSTAPVCGRIQLITGPNMAGKSTYIRQAALITVMAQMGSFVPASEARVGIADRVFARVGASDELGKGQSTFMVEMTETARILNTASDRSVVILDEIGRGTSTYDGVSLAWAITEFLHDEIQCRAMFATHYHELTELSRTLKHASNWNVAVREQPGDGIVFLHKIVEGSADKSYGIHVARIAGVPKTVLERADVILETLENEHVDDDGRPRVPARKTSRVDRRQLSLFDAPEHPVLDEIRQLEIENLTPLDALQELNRIREQLK